jgi:two-component system cell cycle response regulator
MPARILVVDDQPLNIRLMEAKLGGEYYDVMTAPDGPTALERVAADPPDLIILDIMMPGMDGFEVCHRLKADPASAYIPVVMITALNAPEERVRGLDAGADDFLTRPVDDIALFARIRSLLRWKLTQDELLSRQATSRAFGVMHERAKVEDSSGRLLVVTDFVPEADDIEVTLAGRHEVTSIDELPDPAVPLPDFDLAIVSLGASRFDGLRLVSHLRSRPDTRDLPIIGLIEEQDRERLAKALDLGMNDYVVSPLEPSELVVRVRNQLRRYRAHLGLRAEYWSSLSAAATDALTGLYGRRYLVSHLERQLGGAREDGRELAVVMIDVDHFKSINDRYGHSAGDRALKAIAERIMLRIRSTDLAARYGGEEFIVMMPATDRATAAVVAERLREGIAKDPVPIGGEGAAITVTASVGIASRRPGDSPESIIDRADRALYDAKRVGRNRVVEAMA